MMATQPPLIYRVAVCGTPGCGKSSLTHASSQKILTVEELSWQHGVALAHDPVDDTASLDISELSKRLDSEWNTPPAQITLIDGHLSYLLPVDAIVIVRCHPTKLRERLNLRGYHPSKVEENVEVELLGGPWPEIIDEMIDLPIIEVDSTDTTVDELWKCVSSWLAAELIPSSPVAPIDWISETGAE